MRTAGKNRKAYELVCVWCGIVFRTARPDAKTHSPKCRSRLNDYVKRYGHEPAQPLGEYVTARDRAARDQAYKEKHGSNRRPK